MSAFSPGKLLERLSPRERKIFYLVVLTVFLFAVQKFVLSPVLGKMSELDEAIKAQEQKIEKSFVISSREKEIAAQKERYSSVFSALPSEEETASFLQDIEGLAKTCGVYLMDIQPSGQTTKGITREYSLELNFEARMEQVFRFFYEMTRSDKLIKIVRYQIRPKSQDSSIAVCNISISKMVVK